MKHRRTHHQGRVSTALLVANAIAIVAMLAALFYFDHKRTAEAPAPPSRDQLLDLLQNTEAGRQILKDATARALQSTGTDAVKRTIASMQSQPSTAPAATHPTGDATGLQGEWVLQSGPAILGGDRIILFHPRIFLVMKGSEPHLHGSYVDSPDGKLDLYFIESAAAHFKYTVDATTLTLTREPEGQVTTYVRK